QMTTALAKSLVECNGFDPANVAAKYLAWYVSGDCRGMGSTTSEALFHLKLGSTWQESGVSREDAMGNGTAMRVSPIGLAYRNNLKLLMDAAEADAIITHNNSECVIGSQAV